VPHRPIAAICHTVSRQNIFLGIILRPTAIQYQCVSGFDITLFKRLAERNVARRFGRATRILERDSDRLKIAAVLYNLIRFAANSGKYRMAEQDPQQCDDESYHRWDSICAAEKLNLQV
jgi:hypothetical protein